MIIVLLILALIICFLWRLKVNVKVIKRNEELKAENNSYIEQNRLIKQEIEDKKKQLADEFNDYREAKKTAYEAECQLMDKTIEIRREQVQHLIDTLEENSKQEEIKYNSKIDNLKQNYESLIKPLSEMEKTKLERAFYSIQVDDNAKEDISYLLKEVEPHITNKDLIPKLIWSEYIQKPTVELMKRIEMADTPGIYKITNLNNGKVYIGQSTKIKSRCQDHIKGALGISSIADQKIHHAMAEEGIWNFSFEKLCECEKSQLNEKEKFYIEFFNANNYGYNLTKGNG